MENHKFSYSKEFKIVIMGDVCPTKDYRNIFNKNDPEELVGKYCTDLIREADIVVANLEAPATYSNMPIDKCGPNLKAMPQDIELLKKMGIKVLSLANNHILDYGNQGVLDTLKTCKQQEIMTVGGGKNLHDAKKTCLLSLAEKKIGIISFAEEEFNLASYNSPGANYFDPYESFDEIKQAKSECDYLIVLYHGGIEHYRYPSPLLQKKCRKIVKCGADIVLCQHSHCIGTIEQLQGSTILYGQGNSIFGYRKGNDAWNEGLLVRIIISDDTKVDFKLLNATPKGVRLADKEISIRRLEKIYEDSKNVYDPVVIQTNWNKYCNSCKSLNLPLLYGKSRVYNKMNRILNNKMIELFFNRRKKMITMNLIRCEAHHEAIRTILEKEVFGDE